MNKTKRRFAQWYTNVRQVTPGAAFVAGHHYELRGKTPDILVGTSESGGEHWECFVTGCTSCRGATPEKFLPSGYWRDDAIQLSLLAGEEATS